MDYVGCKWGCWFKLWVLYEWVLSCVMMDRIKVGIRIVKDDVLVGKLCMKLVEVCFEELMVVVEMLFFVQGVEVIIISEIVEYVQVVKGMFYYYFELKIDMFVVFVQCYIVLFFDQLQQVVDVCDVDDWFVCLCVWICVSIDIYVVIYCMYDIVYMNYYYYDCENVDKNVIFEQFGVIFDGGVWVGMWWFVYLQVIVLLIYVGVYGVIDYIIVVL